MDANSSESLRRQVKALPEILNRFKSHLLHIKLKLPRFPG